MFRTKLQMLAALLLGLALLGAGTMALTQQAPAAKPAPPPPKPDANLAKAPEPETADQRATRLARRAHAQAAAIDKLPRFSYQVRYRHGIVDSMRAIDVSLDRLSQALTAPVLDKDWVGWYQTSFSWDEKRFISELSPGDTNLAYAQKFWTTKDAWDRHESKEKTSVYFVRLPELASLWDVPDHPAHTSVNLFDYSYLRLTPHCYWWGKTVARGNSHSMNSFPPEKASWKDSGRDKFGGETCAVVESPERAQRLWIGEESGQVRGALTYVGNLEPNELIQFDDYREVAPGVWLPFREVRSFPHSSETAKNKHLLRRSELIVEAAKTDLDLAGRYTQLLPREGDPVQDQRFAAPVNYRYDPRRSDEEIQKMAEAEFKKSLQGQEEFKRVVQPLNALVGKPAPALPTEGWIGGLRPDVSGKPHLLHFWATWCGPCKSDLPRLKVLAEKGVMVVGMHPSGTSAQEVEKVIRDQKLGYPTFLASGKNQDTKDPIIAGYPARVFPYCIVVDAQGQVAGHGLLSDVLDKFGIDRLIAPKKDDAGK
jgi:thiol-disulfide isomerase/thioredoxin